MATAVKHADRAASVAVSGGRTHAARYLGDAIWLLRTVAGVAILLASHNWPMFWRPISFLIGLTVLTYPVRAVRWGVVYDFLLIGFLFGFVIVGVQYVIEVGILARHATVFRSAVVAPLTEEPLKVLPLVLLLLVPRFRFRHSYGASDLMLLAGALGSGFELFESSLHRHVFPGSPVGPSILGWTVFPDSIGGYLGHGAASALIGLAIGYMIYALRWRRLAPVGIAAAGLATFWMMVDHGLANFQNHVSLERAFFLIRWVWALDGRGRATPYVFFVLIVLTVAAEWLLLRKTVKPIPRLGSGKALAAVAAPLRRGLGYWQLRAAVMRVKTLLLYVLAFRQLGYLGIHLKGDVPRDREAIGRSLARRTLEIIAVQRAVRAS